MNRDFPAALNAKDAATAASLYAEDGYCRVAVTG
jgi:ketosteroid isomerase-like protein